jgi:hypothetical protein
VIRGNIRLAEAPSFGQPITVYDPKSNGAEDYRALAAEVMGRGRGRGLSMAKRSTIGSNPLDAVVPMGRSEPAAEASPEPVAPRERVSIGTGTGPPIGIQKGPRSLRFVRSH